MIINKDSVEWITGRYKCIDPMGSVFRHEDKYFRAIYPKQQKYVEDFMRGPYQALLERNLVLPTIASPHSMKPFPLLLESDALLYTGIPEENWSREMWRTAVLAYLDICIALLPYDLQVYDGKFNNFVQLENGRIVLVDLGAITPAGDFGDYNIFFSRMFNPMLLASSDPDFGPVARKLWNVPTPLLRRIGNIYVKVRGSSESPIKRVRDNLLLSLNRFLIHNAPSVFYALKLLLFRGQYADALHLLRDYAANMTFPQLHTEWGRYYGATRYLNVDKATDRLLPQEMHADPSLNRNELIRRLYERINPQSVIDLGCNEGKYSYHAEACGARVLAMDMDEACIDAMHLKAKNENYKKNIHLFLGDVALNKRENKAECVLALALTHHLLLRQKFKYSYVAEMLASYSTKALIAEFMVEGLGHNKPRPDPLPSHYCIENLAKCLETYFDHVEVINPFTEQGNSAHSKRAVIFCTNRNGKPATRGSRADFPYTDCPVPFLEADEDAAGDTRAGAGPAAGGASGPTTKTASGPARTAGGQKARLQQK